MKLITPIDVVFYVFCGIALLAVLSIAAYDQMEDEAQSAAVVSNAKHIAKLDAAERKREAILQAFADQVQQPADDQVQP